jgi:DNA-binding response OmpR family regulator
MLNQQSTLAWQAQRIEALEAEVAYLRDQLAEATGDASESILMSEYGLTHQEARVLARLMQPAPTLAALAVAMRTESGAPERLVQVIVCRIRAKLARVGLAHAIETAVGLGYRLTPHARRALAVALDETPAQEMSR